eukprot:TRINITY_DN4659_c0_g1_i7.p1 TRINITY_DN4659_c0_g1~~TRINITY_DN4659_c0_g1_i7.p1  ORF type:complete len:297 (-),score=76.41 TRINITY_DN4659_c0_g1_i7:471-1361(-)
MCIRDSFYPFCRNHNDMNTTDQEPYINKNLVSTAKSALKLRYSLIRYLYTLHLDVAINGGVYFMPLFFEFVNDPEAFKRTQHSFMVGSALKVTPVLAQDVSQVTSYFPNSNWYSLDTGKKVMEYKKNAKSGKNITLPADFITINVHIRGGSIIPTQNSEAVMTTADLKKQRTDFIIALDHSNRAEGFVLFDDEVSINTVANNDYARIHLSYANTKIAFARTRGVYELRQGNAEEILGRVRVFGAKSLREIKTGWASLKNGKKTKMTGQYDQKNEILSLYSEEEISLNYLVEITMER